MGREDTRQKTLSRVLMGLSLAWMESLAFRYCRGIVMADVLVKGLNRGAIATRKLKGV